MKYKRDLLFSKRWKEIGLGEDELQALQIMSLKDPESGPVFRLLDILSAGEEVEYVVAK